MQRDINFFSVYRSSGNLDRGVDTVTVVGIGVVGACVLGLLGVFGYYRLSNVACDLQRQQIQSYLGSTAVQKAQSSWSTYTQKLAALKNYANEAGRQTAAFKTMPVLDSGLLGAIAGAMPADVKVQALNYSGSSLSLNCTSTDKLSPANFVYTLKGTQKFADVSYSSVTQNGAGYNFQVNCTLKAVTTK